jgi:hypothetical protein
MMDRGQPARPIRLDGRRWLDRLVAALRVTPPPPRLDLPLRATWFDDDITTEDVEMAGTASGALIALCSTIARDPPVLAGCPVPPDAELRLLRLQIEPLIDVRWPGHVRFAASSVAIEGVRMTIVHEFRMLPGLVASSATTLLLRDRSSRTNVPITDRMIDALLTAEPAESWPNVDVSASRNRPTRGRGR